MLPYGILVRIDATCSARSPVMTGPKFSAPMNAVVEHTPKPEKSAYEKLPRRYRRFVDEWVSGKTAPEAIKAAGYKRLYPHQASAKLRRRPEIAAAIAEREAEAVREAGARHVTVIR